MALPGEMALPGIREDVIVFRVKEGILSEKHINNDTIAPFLIFTDK